MANNKFNARHGISVGTPAIDVINSDGQIVGELSGNASTATALSNSRTIAITGDISYTSGSFNGTSDVTGTATLANSGVTAGVYGSSSAIPVITVDSKGRLTSASTTSLTVPTLTSQLTNDSGFATTSYVDTSVSNLVASSPAALDTLNELAAALGNDANFATTTATSLGLKAVKTTTISAGTGLTGGGDLSSNRTLSLETSGVTAGTYNNVTVDVYGRATAGSNTAYLTAEADTFATVTARGATTTTSVTLPTLTLTASNSIVFQSNSNAGIFSETHLYTNITNTAGSQSNGIFIERGRITNSSTAEVRHFTIGSTGGQVQWKVDGSGNSTQTGTIGATNFSGSSSGTNTGDQTLPTLSSLSGQPLDADLTAIAALAGTSGLLKKTAANTWSLDTTAYTTNLGTVTSVTATAPVASSGGTTPVISMAAATTSVNGYLTSTDWTTFNNKQAALGFTPYNSTNPSGYTTNVGTVTSVATSGTVSGLTLTGGTITTTGTVTLGGTLEVLPSNFASQTANTVLAAPDGAAGAPTFRNLTLNDLPDAWVKKAVGAATTAALTINTAQVTIDGVTLAASTRVLIKNQVAAGENGIYTGVTTTTWVRTPDADTASEIAGAFVNVDAGTVNGGKVFDNDFKSTDTLGTTAMNWSQNVDVGYFTTVGNSFVTLANPTAITFPRINADNTVSALAAAAFRTAIGAGTSSTTGTVTSVAALTIGTTGTDITSTVATGTTTPVITLNIPTASAANRGALSSADWTTFNNKQPAGTYATGTGTASGTNTGDNPGVTAVAAVTPIVSSGGTTPSISHATSGASAGTYNTVTVNTFGHVTAGSNTAYLTTLTDTLATVTARGATTSTASTFSGGITHSGLTMTAGTNVDQIYTASDVLTLTTAWQDTSVNAAELVTGSYMVQVYADDNAVGGGHYYTYYTGIMSWYSADTNEASSDEIVLHRAGHASTTGNIFLRVLRTMTADTNNMKLQIAGITANTGTSTYTYKFRRLI